MPFSRPQAQLLRELKVEYSTVCVLRLLKLLVEIKDSRKDAWAIVEKRNHTVAKCYTCNDDASDLLCIGDAVLNLKNGKEVAGNFISRTVLVGTNTSAPRIKYFEVWGVSAAFLFFTPQSSHFLHFELTTLE